MEPFSTRQRIVGLVVILAVGLLCGIKIVTSIAQAIQQERTAMPPWKVKKVGPKRLGVKAKEPNSATSLERVIEDQVPSHLPIKIELNNLQAEPLLRNLEVKVTNTSTKPIYFLELDILLPDVLSLGGHPTGFPLRYGRTRLIDFEEPLRPEDVPIRPGESFVFTIPEKNLGAFERRMAKMNVSQAAIKKLYLLFQQINFGDKTGFSTTGGSPVPNLKGQNSHGSCGGGRGGKARPDSTNAQAINSPATFLSHFSGRVLIKVNDSSPSLLSQSNLCCPGSFCPYVKQTFYSCYCGEGRTTQIVGCQDPLGQCSDIFQMDKDCSDEQGVEYHCPEFLRQACSGYCDLDNDGWYSDSVECGGLDCDDNDPNITPFTPPCPTASPSPSPSPSPTPCVYTSADIIDCNEKFGNFDYLNCKCEMGPPRDLCPNRDPECMSPIVIDTAGNGFNLTSGAAGVSFDLTGDGLLDHIAWTATGSDDSWLALDRNGNGLIDNGKELFGNFTAQTLSSAPNGFLALASFDRAGLGGNGDGVIDRRDTVFASLRLWQDTNHNGQSETNELHTLRSLGVARLDLDYRESRRVDEHGNRFKYRAKVRDARGAQVGRWAWDVFLVSAP